MIEKVDRTYEWDCQYQSLRLILNKNYRVPRGLSQQPNSPLGAREKINSHY